ncbi:prostate and testis expressed protein 4 [Notamacropus eugenii]|uniref:prostate and testis expressed protein 4 n=1 Tax=Notamacropus eugenii TaxID=9315 RepID=UPI003B67220F
MDKLFLLVLSVLCLSTDGKLSRIFLKNFDWGEGVACHVCKRSVNGHCLENKDNCVVEVPSSCETKVFYPVGQDTYAMLTCNRQCKETEGVANGIRFKIFCCNKDFCNKPPSGGT